MGPKKKKAAKDKKIKKEKNLKDPPPEDLFKAHWPLLTSSPATRSDTPRLSQLQGESGRTVNSTATPVDTTFNNSEIKSSDSLIPNKNKDNKGN